MALIWDAAKKKAVEKNQNVFGDTFGKAYQDTRGIMTRLWDRIKGVLPGTGEDTVTAPANPATTLIPRNTVLKDTMGIYPTKEKNGINKMTKDTSFRPTKNTTPDMAREWARESLGLGPDEAEGIERLERLYGRRGTIAGGFKRSNLLGGIFSSTAGGQFRRTPNQSSFKNTRNPTRFA